MAAEQGVRPAARAGPRSDEGLHEGWASARRLELPLAGQGAALRPTRAPWPDALGEAPMTTSRTARAA